MRQIFYQKIFEILWIATERDHAIRLHEMLEGKPSVDAIAREFNRARGYSIDDPHILHYLAFEYAQNCRLFTPQVQLIQQILKSDKATIHRLIMGSGKTSTITPLLASILADGQKFVVLVVPRAQFAEARELLKSRSHEALHQEVDALDFSTQKVEENKDLRLLVKRLKTLKESRGYLLVPPETLHDFLLLYIETLDKAYSSSDEALIVRLTLLESILQLLSQETVLLLDEADLLLQRKKQRKFAIGEFQPLQGNRFTLLKELYRQLLKVPKLLLRQNRQLEFSESDFAKLRPELARHIAQSELFMLQDAEALADFVRYVCNKEVALPSRFEKRDIEFHNLIALTKELLNIVLPLTLKHSSNEHYIFSAERKERYAAIPTLTTNKPSEGSQFSHPYEAYCSTIQHYIYERLTHEKVRRWINDLKNDGFKEVAADKEITLDKSAAALFFEETLCPRFSAKKGLFQVRDEDIPAIAEELNRQDEAIFLFIERYVQSEMGYYKNEIASNAFFLLENIHTTHGFTGTRPNPHSLSTRILTNSTALIDATLLQLMTSQKKRARLFVSQAGNSARELLQNLKRTGLLTRHRALIDVGGWVKFAGVTNEDFARLLFEQFPEAVIDAVIFFSSRDDNKYILFRGKSQAELLSLHKDHPHSRTFVFYDKAHSIGADLVLAPDIEALLTMSLDTPISIFFQGVGRLRKYSGEQRFDVVVSEEFQRRLEPFEIEELIYASMEVQAREERSDNFISVIEQLDAKLRSHCLTGILKTGTDFASKMALWAESRHFFIKERSDDCYRLYGMPDTLVPPSEALAATRTTYSKEIAKTVHLRADLEAILRTFSCQAHEKFPELVYSKFDPMRGIEEEVKKETRYETHNQNRAETSERESQRIGESVQFEFYEYTTLLEALEQNDPETFFLLQEKEAPLSCFDERLLFTKNFDKRFTGQLSSFEFTQELADYVWIYWDENDFSVVLLQRNEAETVLQGLKGLTSKEGCASCQQALYNMGTNRIYQQPACKELQLQETTLHDPELQLLLSQVKLFNGDSDLTRQELDALQEWLQEEDVGPQMVRKLFEEKLLTRNRELVVRYQNSALQKLLNEVQNA